MAAPVPDIKFWPFGHDPLWLTHASLTIFLKILLALASSPVSIIARTFCVGAWPVKNFFADNFDPTAMWDACDDGAEKRAEMSAQRRSAVLRANREPVLMQAKLGTYFAKAFSYLCGKYVNRPPIPSYYRIRGRFDYFACVMVSA